MLLFVFVNVFLKFCSGVHRPYDCSEFCSGVQLCAGQGASF